MGVGGRFFKAEHDAVTVWQSFALKNNSEVKIENGAGGIWDSG
jgi:hypothetical protein